MAIDSKLDLSDKYFKQSTGGTLTLSGNTIINGGLNFASGYTPTDNTSVVTKQYTDAIGVDNLVFTDGLSRSGNTVILGGTTFNPIELSVENDFTITSTNLSLTDVDNTFNEVPKDAILVNDQWLIYTTLGGSEYNIGKAQYRYNVTTFDVTDAGFTSFVPSVHITKKRTDIEGEYEELYFNINGNPSGWTGTTITNLDSYLLKLTSSRNFLLVHEADYASPTLNGDVLIFDLIGQTVDRVSNYIPEINNFSFPNGSTEVGSKNIFKDLNIQQINNGSDFALSFYDRTTSILHYYKSEGTGTTIQIQSGDTITGDLTSFPSISNVTFTPLIRNVVSTSNLGDVLSIDLDTTDFNNKYYYFNITTGEINNYSLTTTQVDFLTSVSNDINGSQDNIYDFKQIITDRFSGVQSIYTLPTKQILFDTGTDNRIIEFGNVYYNNFANLPDRTISINGDNGSIDYSLVNLGSREVKYTISGFNYDYSLLGSNTTISDIRPNGRYLPNGAGNVTGDTWFDYERNIFTLSLTNSGFTYPSTYNPPIDGLITRRVLSGQTINDFTSYSANTENIAGADAFNDLKTTVDGINGETLTFDNGLTRTNDNVQLGGDLSSATILNSFNGLDVQGDGVNINNIKTDFSVPHSNFGDLTGFGSNVATLESFNNNYQFIVSKVTRKVRIYDKGLSNLEEFDLDNNIIPSGWTISGDTDWLATAQSVSILDVENVRRSYNTFLITAYDGSSFPVDTNFILFDVENKKLTIYNSTVVFEGSQSMVLLDGFTTTTNAIYSRSGETYLLISGFDEFFNNQSYLINQSGNTLTDLGQLYFYWEQVYIGSGANPNALTNIFQEKKFTFFSGSTLSTIDAVNAEITPQFDTEDATISIAQPYLYIETPDVSSIVSATLLQDQTAQKFRRFIAQPNDILSEDSSGFPDDVFGIKKHIYTDNGRLQLGFFGFSQGTPRKVKKYPLTGLLVGSFEVQNIFTSFYSDLESKVFHPDFYYVDSIDPDDVIITTGNTSFVMSVGDNGFKYPIGYTPTENTNLLTLGNRNETSNKIVTGTTTLTNVDDTVFVDSSGSTLTVSLVAVPKDGLVYTIKDIGGNANVNAITIDGNGKLIDGNSSIIIESDYAGFNINYNATKDAWFITGLI